MNCTKCINYHLCDAAYTAAWSPERSKNNYKSMPRQLRILMIAMDTNNGCDDFIDRGGDIND